MRRRGYPVLIAVVLGLPFAPAYSIAQQPPAERQPLPTLTTAHDAHSLTLEQAARNYPVYLRAVVTYYDWTGNSTLPTFFDGFRHRFPLSGPQACWRPASDPQMRSLNGIVARVCTPVYGKQLDVENVYAPYA